MFASLLLLEEIRTIVVCTGCILLGIGALALAPIWGRRGIRPDGIIMPYKPVTNDRTRVIEFVFVADTDADAGADGSV